MKRCVSCGKEWQDNAGFCGACGGTLENVAPATAVEPPETQPSAQQPKKKRRWLKVLLIVVAVLAVVAVIGAFTNWFGLVSPMQGLINATRRTITANSITATIEGELFEGDFSEEVEAEFRQMIDPKKGTYYIIADSMDDTLCVDNDKNYYISADGDYAYIEESETDVDDMLEGRENLIGKKKTDWKKIVKDNGLEDYVDYRKIDPMLKNFYRDYLRDKKWLKNTLGFEKEGNVYTLKPDIPQLLDDLAEFLEDSKVLKDDAEDPVVDTLDDLAEQAEDLGLELTLTCTVKGGKLVEIKMDITADNESNVEGTITITFDKINKTRITEDEIEEIAEEAEDIIDAHTCGTCGETFFYSDGHSNCVLCGEHGDCVEHNGKRYCYSCYYASDDCSLCGNFGSYYTYGGKKYCSNCYYNSGTCSLCGDFGEYRYYSGRKYCDDCYSKRSQPYGYCEWCGDYAYLYDYGSSRVCYDCW